MEYDELVSEIANCRVFLMQGLTGQDMRDLGYSKHAVEYVIKEATREGEGPCGK